MISLDAVQRERKRVCAQKRGMIRLKKVEKTSKKTNKQLVEGQQVLQGRLVNEHNYRQTQCFG